VAPEGSGRVRPDCIPISGKPRPRAELLNAAFEDHTEREYMLYVAEHPELEDQPYGGMFEQDYASYASLADLFRQIGHNEQVHKEESLANLAESRLLQ
jgi:hypothetical protein